MRQRRCIGVVMHAVMAGKSVVLAVINMHLGLHMRGQTVGNGGLGVFGNKRVLGSDMDKCRRGNIAGFAQKALYADAVIRSVGVAIGAASGEIDHAAAKAKTDCADLGTSGGAQIIDRGLQIANPSSPS